MWVTFLGHTLGHTFRLPSSPVFIRVGAFSQIWVTLFSLFPAVLKIIASNKGIKANNRESRGKNRDPLLPTRGKCSGSAGLGGSRSCDPKRDPKRDPNCDRKGGEL